MRNCFVPNCDQVSKHIAKRKMFFPPKNPEIFKAWEDALPKKRQLRTHDRVCERHFHNFEISTYWEHVINGKVHLLERGKARLYPNSIPSLNLSPKTTPTVATAAITTGGTSKTTTTTTTNRKINKTTQVSLRKLTKTTRPPPPAEDTEEITKTIPITTKTLPDLLIEPQIEQPIELLNSNNILQIDELMTIGNHHNNTSDIDGNQSIEQEIGKENNEEIIKEDPNFDSLYDDIYEVELPSTQYGIHRDPNRKYIVFSYFDIEKMSATKVLYVDCYFKSKIYFYNEQIKCNSHTDSLTVELISEMLSDIDEYRICDGFLNDEQKNNDECCLIIALNNSQYCSNCKL